MYLVQLYGVINMPFGIRLGHDPEGRRRRRDERNRQKEEEDRLLRMDEGTLIEPGMDDPFIQDQIRREVEEIKNRPDLADKVEDKATWAGGVPVGKVAGGAVKAGSALLGALGAGKDALVNKVKDIKDGGYPELGELEDIDIGDRPAPQPRYFPDRKADFEALSTPQKNMAKNIMRQAMQGDQSPFAGIVSTPPTKDYGSLYDVLAPEQSSDTIKSDDKTEAKTDAKKPPKTETKTEKTKVEEKPKAKTKTEPEVAPEVEEDLLLDDEGQFIGGGETFDPEQLTGDEQRDEIILNMIAEDQEFEPEAAELERFDAYQQNLEAGLPPEAAAYFADKEEAQMMAPVNEPQSEEEYAAELEMEELERLVNQFEMAGDDPSSDKTELYWQLQDKFRDIDASDFFGYRPQVTSRGVGRSNFPNMDWSVNPDSRRLGGQTQIGQGPLRIEEGARRLPPGPGPTIEGGTRAGLPPYRMPDTGIQNPAMQAWLEQEAARRGFVPLSERQVNYNQSRVERLAAKLESLRNRVFPNRQPRPGQKVQGVKVQRAPAGGGSPSAYGASSLIHPSLTGRKAR